MAEPMIERGGGGVYTIHLDEYKHECLRGKKDTPGNVHE